MLVARNYDATLKRLDKIVVHIHSHNVNRDLRTEHVELKCPEIWPERIKFENAEYDIFAAFDKSRMTGGRTEKVSERPRASRGQLLSRLLGNFRDLDRSKDWVEREVQRRNYGGCTVVI